MGNECEDWDGLEGSKCERGKGKGRISNVEEDLYTYMYTCIE
jgi:hypothetical protein